jgi:hypothetical protein
LEIVTEEFKPRFVYEPKHAAADFSRLAVSPLSPTRQQSSLPVAEDDQLAIPRNTQRHSRHYGEEPIPRRSRSDRHSYTLVGNPSQNSNDEVHLLDSREPMAWSPKGQPTVYEEQPPTRPAQPLSDYELFVARAEAKEREQRERAEQVLRSISQRSAAYLATRVQPDPHRQFAAGTLSSVERSYKSQLQRSARGQYNHGGGAKQQQQQQQQPQQPPAPQRERKPTAGKGHARQSSWAPSYATGESAVEKVLERRKSPPPPPPPAVAEVRSHPKSQPRRPPEMPTVPISLKPIVYSVDPPRTLRRQASLSQRIAEYIRPPKVMRQVGALVE